MRRTLALAVLIVGAATAWGPALRGQSAGTHPISGRQFAFPMSVEGAPWLERRERVDEEEPDLALRLLRVAKGSTVADIGAGSGYMTVRLAKIVGPMGRVYANDIQPGMLELLQKNVEKNKLTNVTPVLGAIDDPKLPADSIDLAIMVDVYHELAAPQAFLRRLRPALKKDGRLVLLEFRKEDPRVPILEVHKMSVREVRQELESEGFRLSAVLNDLPWQHILVLTVADTP